MHTTPYTPNTYARQRHAWRRLWLVLLVAALVLLVPVALVSVQAAAVGVAGGLACAWLVRHA